MKKAQIIRTGAIVSIDTSIESKNGTLWHVYGTQNYILEDELRFLNLDSIWDFIMVWHPNYNHSDEIAWIDDLDCALDNECDEEKLSRIIQQWGATTEEWIRHKSELEKLVFSEALDNYYQNLRGHYL
ncbi:MAG: hypothetical protein NC411_01200 [Bacteroides sp.]|nr:hypothetical protein [Bacteroides sp.]